MLRGLVPIKNFPNCGAFTVTLDVLPRLSAGVLNRL